VFEPAAVVVHPARQATRQQTTAARSPRYDRSAMRPQSLLDDIVKLKLVSCDG
jgi:hypothetical protein